MQISSRKFSRAFWTKILSASALSIAILTPALSGQASSQTKDPTDAVFRASTQLVVVDVLAEHRKTGLAVRGLTRADFEVYEDKVRQEITQFSLDTVPLSIVFLFDMTDSVRPVLKPLAEGALAALNHLKPEDEIAVMLYAARADLTQDFTRDHATVARAIQSASAMRRGHCASSVNPGPPLGERELCSQDAFFNEGIFQATRYGNKSGNPSNRRVIIWLTDNVPNVPDGKVHSEAEALDLVRESGVVICTLLERSGLSNTLGALYARNPMFEPFRMAHPTGDVNKYAAESGGIVISARREEISTKLADMIDRIRGRYTIGYRPSVDKPEGTLCKIEVRLSREALRREGVVEIRARRGYKR